MAFGANRLGYVEYDSASGKFSMLPEQVMALADEDSPVFLGAVGSLVSATFLDEPKISEYPLHIGR